MLWLKTKIHLADMDKLISAEIPPKSDPILLSIVKKQMVHSHTEACKDGSKCKKKFPKAFTPFTIMNSDGYPSYKRRSPQDGGHTFEIKRGEEIIQIDNSWIVPYCPFLSRAFQCHINVEYCSSIKSIKYVCKYVLKVILFTHSIKKIYLIIFGTPMQHLYSLETDFLYPTKLNFRKTQGFANLR